LFFEHPACCGRLLDLSPITSRWREFLWPDLSSNRKPSGSNIRESKITVEEVLLKLLVGDFGGGSLPPNASSCRLDWCPG
jgi:hypothetical protein